MKVKPKVTIIDYEIGNLYSVKNALEYVGLEPIISNKIDIIMNSDAIILPGVGAFNVAMRNLEALELVDSIKKFVESGKSFMGICLGMQLLFSQSEEFGKYKGLDIIKGNVVRIKNDKLNLSSLKVPQVGWNQVYASKLLWDNTEMANISNGEYMYFVHSFYVEPEDCNKILSVTDYEGVTYCSSIKVDNVFACQFHPEKSGKEGIKILENFKASILK